MRRNEDDRQRDTSRAPAHTQRDRGEIRTEYDGVCGTRSVWVTREQTEAGEVESERDIGSVSEPMS